MKPIIFKEGNAVLKAPAGQENDVQELPAFINESEIISCWKLDEEEIKQVMETGIVWLRVAGHTHPPLLLSIQSPFVDPNEPKPVEDLGLVN